MLLTCTPKLRFPGAHLEQPEGHELEVAVPDGVHAVKAQEVGVEHGPAGAATRPGAQQRDGEVGGVHQVLRKRVHRP